MKIPFKFLPASWGLKGTTRDIAEAEYELEGLPLEIRLAEINHSKNPKAKAMAILQARHNYQEVSQYDFSIEMANLTLEGNNLQLELFTIWHKFNKITEREFAEGIALNTFTGTGLEQERLRIKRQYEEITEIEYRTAIIKLTVNEGIDQDLELNDMNLDLGVITEAEFKKTEATIKGHAYVAVINSTFKPEDKLDGLYFEFDWNDLWIDELKLAGYQGFTDDQIIQRWFEDLCRGVISEELGDDGQPIPFNSGRIINQVRRDGGPTEYS